MYRRHGDLAKRTCCTVTAFPSPPFFCSRRAAELSKSPPAPLALERPPGEVALSRGGSPHRPGGRPRPGLRLQLHAAASRWNFLTNAEPGYSSVPGRRQARGLPAIQSLALAGAGCLGGNA